MGEVLERDGGTETEIDERKEGRRKGWRRVPGDLCLVSFAVTEATGRGAYSTWRYF